MKYDEASDVATILVEAADEKALVLRFLSLQHKPVVVVLPEDTLFRRPGDLLELMRTGQRSTHAVTLVIEGNERLRSWARRQGYTVFSSREACANALAQRPTRAAEFEASEPTLPTVAAYPQQSVATLARQERIPIEIRDTEPLRPTYDQRIARIAHSRWQERLFLLLIVLCVLGILGGLGFGYLFTVAHTTTSAPAALLAGLS